MRSPAALRRHVDDPGYSGTGRNPGRQRHQCQPAFGFDPAIVESQIRHPPRDLVGASPPATASLWALNAGLAMGMSCSQGNEDHSRSPPDGGQLWLLHSLCLESLHHALVVHNLEAVCASIVYLSEVSPQREVN